MMLLDKQQIKKISHWWNTTKEINGVLYDRIIVSYGGNVMAFYPFKRVAYCYFDEDAGYTIKTIPSVDYIELRYQLSRKSDLLHINSK